MQKIDYEVGFIYDTLAFLSYFTDELIEADMIPDSIKTNKHYIRIKQAIAEKSLNLPEYIYPFVCKAKKTVSFLQAFILDAVPYSKCTHDRFMRLLNADFRRNYIRFYCPNVSELDEEILLSADKPEVISVVKNSRLDKMIDTYFINSIFFYDEIIELLVKIINVIYEHICQMHQLFFQNNDMQRTLQIDTVLEKLRAITGAEYNSTYTFSLSLIEDEIISFKEDEPEFVLLGYDFTKRLENEYKYCHVTPLLFAQAIGNPIKYDIIKTLSKLQPMCISDMAIALNYSNNELVYNLNELRKTGIVIIDHVKRRTNFYKTNRDYIKIVAEQLLLFT